MQRWCRTISRLSAGWTLTVVALIIWVFVHGDFGMTADEPVQSRYGEAVRNYIAGNITYDQFTHSPNLPRNIFFYGPTLDLTCATLAHIFGADIFSIRHGVQGLMWVAMFWPICALGRRLSGKAGAWFAGLALLGMPSLFGQAFNNPKDLPLACATIWLVHAAASVAARRRPDWRSALALGVAIGFVLAMRPGAWFLCVVTGLPTVMLVWRTRKISGAWRMDYLSRSLLWLMAACLLGWCLMILPWPSAWHSPLLQPVRAALFALHFNEIYPVLFDGKFYPSNQLPWDYLASYLLLTLPLPLTGLCVWGHVVCWRKFFCTTARAAVVLAVVFVIWLPLTAFVVLRPNVYDGMRHFLFVLPPLTVLAGVAAADIARRQRLVPRMISYPAMGLLLLSAVPAMIRLHPYENVYYNFLAGPKRTLDTHYETDYWFSSYRAAAEWINKQQAQSKRPLRVLVAGLHFYSPVFTHYVNSKTQTTLAGIGDMTKFLLPTNYDYYVATSRYDQLANFSDAPIVHRIARDGITLTVIRANPQNQKP